MNNCTHELMTTMWESQETAYKIKRCVECDRILCTYTSINGDEYNVTKAVRERAALRAAISAVVTANAKMQDMSQPLEDARRLLEDSNG